MNDSPLPLLERAAYHEAGHLVMARELDIRVDSACMPPIGSTAHASRFASLNELHHLESGNDREKRLAVQQYVRLLLAGPAAVLLRLEAHHSISNDSPHLARFRFNWLARAKSRGDADIDLTYSLLLGWGNPSKHVEEEFPRYWDLAIASYEYPTLWQQVSRTAGRLLESTSFPA